MQLTREYVNITILIKHYKEKDGKTPRYFFIIILKDILTKLKNIAKHFVFLYYQKKQPLFFS